MVACGAYEAASFPTLSIDDNGVSAVVLGRGVACPAEQVSVP